MTVDPCAGGFMTSLLGAFFTYFILVIQESSPASEMTESFGSRSNSRTGVVVPRMRLCMASSSIAEIKSRCGNSLLYHRSFGSSGRGFD